MKAGKINPVSLERLFRHFKLEQTTEQPLPMNFRKSLRNVRKS